MSIIEKIITKSNSHQIKTKKKPKTKTKAKFKNTFPFFKTINFTVIYVIRYQLKPVKMFIYI